MNIRRQILLALVTLNAGFITHAAPFIYVADNNDDFVYVINAANNEVVTSINMGAFSNIGVAVTPDNSTVFVTCQDNTVKRINVATNTLLPDIAMGANPNDLAITPDGLYAYVTCADNTVKRINIATNSVDVTIPGFNNPFAITIAPNGLTAYVSDMGSHSIIPIDIATNTLGTIVTGAPISIPFALVVDPSNSYLYVANDNAGNVLQFNVSTNRLAPTLSNTITLAPGNFIVGVAITPDGNYLYATDNSANSIFPINISNPASPVVDTAVSMGVGPGPALIIAPNGSYAYIPNTNGTTVTPLNITNRAAPVAAADITVGSHPTGIAITSVPAPTDISGTVKKNVFLLQTGFVLVITWTPNVANAIASPAAYNIYSGTSLVQTVSANCPPLANVYLPSCNDTNNYFISTVYSDGTQSMHVPVVVS